MFTDHHKLRPCLWPLSIILSILVQLQLLLPCRSGGSASLLLSTMKSAHCAWRVCGPVSKIPHNLSVMFSKLPEQISSQGLYGELDVFRCGVLPSHWPISDHVVGVSRMCGSKLVELRSSSPRQLMSRWLGRGHHCGVQRLCRWNHEHCQRS